MDPNDIKNTHIIKDTCHHGIFNIYTQNITKAILTSTLKGLRCVCVCVLFGAILNETPIANYWFLVRRGT
jgi:hypothetical protein